MDGFINVNKPLGKTSSDVVVYVRRRLPRGTRVGHGGTLDPEASGVLPVCVGGAARLFDYIIDKEKTYIATLRLGIVTDTQDAGGAVIQTREVSARLEDVARALPHFEGEIEQIPPMYSAIKKDGKRLYQLARNGESVEIPARKCRVYGIELLEDLGDNRYKLRVRCGKGVYIRTLCHDIGAYLRRPHGQPGAHRGGRIPDRGRAHAGGDRRAVSGGPAGGSADAHGLSHRSYPANRRGRGTYARGGERQSPKAELDTMRSAGGPGEDIHRRRVLRHRREGCRRTD